MTGSQGKLLLEWMRTRGTPVSGNLQLALRIMMIVTVCYKIDTWAKAGGVLAGRDVPR